MEGCYYGTRPGGEAIVVRGRTRDPVRLRTDLVNHSPTGHEWGYPGSGPAQLAFDLLMDATQDDPRFREIAERLGYCDAFGDLTPSQAACRRVYQRFKRMFVQRFDREWTLPIEFVRGWAYGAIASLPGDHRG